MTKTILGSYGNNRGHWVGDGFPVRSLFSYNSLGAHISPFLLLDYAGPHYFEPTDEPARRRPASASRLRDGHHRLRRRGRASRFRRQWRRNRPRRRPVDDGRQRHHPRGVSLAGLRKDRRAVPHDPALGQPARQGQDGSSALPGHHSTPTSPWSICRRRGHGRASSPATFAGAKGPARTFTPINVWDVRSARDADVALDLPEGHTAILVVLTGHVTVERRSGRG